MSNNLSLSPTDHLAREQIARGIAQALDLAVLKPTATASDVYRGCQLVEKEDIASVCVAPAHVAYAKRFTDRVCSVIGFPHGNTFPNVKWREAMMAMDRGAIELDVVVNYGQFLAGRATLLRHELKDLVTTAHKRNVKVKAILEVCYYTPEQINEACQLCVQYGVDWVKTPTLRSSAMCKWPCRIRRTRCVMHNNRSARRWS